MKYLLTILLLSAAGISTFAQTNRWTPTPNIQVGFMGGSFGPALEGRLGFGVKKQGLVLGLASGIDTYRFTSVPLVATATYSHGTRKWKPFASAAAGWNIAAVQPHEKGGQYQYPSGNTRFTNDFIWMPGSWVPASYRSGWLAEIGGGMGRHTKKGHAYTMGLHYSAKTISESMTELVWTGSTQIEHPATAHYLMQRISLRFGFTW